MCCFEAFCQLLFSITNILIWLACVVGWLASFFKDKSRVQRGFLTQGYPATEGEGVHPQPKQILLLLKYWLYLRIIYFWKAKTQPYMFILINWFFNPIQPMGLVLEPKKALKMIFLTLNILYVFGKHFWCTFRFCH